MDVRNEGCLVCGKPLLHYGEARRFSCHGCGAARHANAACEDGHFICDSCHAEPGLVFIARYAQETRSMNPVAIATEMMKNPSIMMHGPEHHFLVPVSLLAAYRNAGGVIDLGKGLQCARQRAQNVPGGICGLWGSCGAGIGTGIFVSVITDASPLSEVEWSLANHMTSRSLAVIAANGGPRCCKRNAYLAIVQAVGFVKERFAVAMEMPGNIACQFQDMNKQCRRGKCLYNPFSQK